MINITIYGQLLTMNQITSASNRNRFAYAKLKKENNRNVAYQVRDTVPLLGKHDYHFKWYRKDKRSDPDNIAAGGCKVFFDGMTDAGILENDGWKQVGKLSHEFFVDKENPRVEIEVMEAIIWLELK